MLSCRASRSGKKGEFLLPSAFRFHAGLHVARRLNVYASPLSLAFMPGGVNRLSRLSFFFLFFSLFLFVFFAVRPMPSCWIVYALLLLEIFQKVTLSQAFSQGKAKGRDIILRGEAPSDSLRLTAVTHYGDVGDVGESLSRQ